MSKIEVSNEAEGPNARPVVAQVFGTWYTINPGKSISVDDPAVAACLAESGAYVDSGKLAAAREAWAERNRDENARAGAVSQSVVPDESQVTAQALRAAQALEDEAARAAAQAEADRQAAAGGEPYDPTAYSADEVKAYLASASPAEVERVKAAEAGRSSGSVRSSITGWSPPSS